MVALGLVAAFTIAIPTLDGHMALAKNTKPKNPNYKGANRQGCGRLCGLWMNKINPTISLFFFALPIFEHPKFTSEDRT